ncbi:hypothetical protein D3C71_1128840 [compost metagenome]
MIKLIITAVVIFLFGLFVLYNANVRTFLNLSQKKTGSLFYRLLGKYLHDLNLDIERKVNLNRKSVRYRFYVYLKDIIINLDMVRYHVTPFGLFLFILTTAVSSSILFVVLFKEYALFIPALLVFFYLTLIVFRFIALSKFEKKESEIMDTVDLIAMDVRGGVYNAIVRYKKVFHPNIAGYFDEFCDNITLKGYSFKEAMLLLNSKLGPNFTDFAHKAILYEEKADKGMEDIFTSVVEVNRHKRTLRYGCNQKFNDLRLQFIISVAIIAVYGAFSIWTDAFLSHFFLKTFGGKLVLLIDVVIVSVVLTYIASIKSKFL